MLSSVQNSVRATVDVFPSDRCASVLYWYWRYYEMYISNYLKFLVKVTNTPFTLVIAVSMQLVYSLSSCLHIFLSLSFSGVAGWSW